METLNNCDAKLFVFFVSSGTALQVPVVSLRIKQPTTWLSFVFLSISCDCIQYIYAPHGTLEQSNPSTIFFRFSFIFFLVKTSQPRRSRADAEAS
ncbi:hypothetical protein HA466_0193020 [Hirschfeldia incana]|nr:hypothetical protein HA466_0193020 [Hirschfeldia incana]KAJ0244718.1 hypothetical protein HA466_0193020 [Hirschfeldia incana]